MTEKPSRSDILVSLSPSDDAPIIISSTPSVSQEIMVMSKLSTDALSGLCTKEQLDLLDSIDTLRLQGISHYISLPQIIVCGDQSSGKISVLEAISGVSFPVKSNLCTRFPTELALRKSAQIGASVSIVPHPSRSESEQRSLSTFRESLDDFGSLPTLIEKAKSIMGISTHGKAFSNDLLRVEVAGPDRPHLTIVDLPGLIHSETKQQSAADVQVVQDVVQSYMKEPRSIILAVVSAKNDFANQIVLRLARTADPSGSRTMGVVTKPDVLISRSETEKGFVSLAKNQEVEFRLGWHVLKNMDTEKGHGTLLERDAQERDFFHQGVWEFMPRNILGIDGLRVRLSELLLSQIATELPDLIDEIRVQVDESNEQLKRLGDARETLQQQRTYLFQISQLFQSTVKAAVDGTYNSEFFNDIYTDSGYWKRLRAVIQNLNESFAEKISRQGHRRQICVSHDQHTTDTSDASGQIVLTRADYTKHIERILQRTRGRELPGTFNPMVVAELFKEQCALWGDITSSHIAKVADSVTNFIGSTAAYIADDATSTVLMREIFQSKLDQLRQAADDKVSELLVPHLQGHPITYNHYFTENLQKIRNQRREREVMSSIQTFFKVSDLDAAPQSIKNINLRAFSNSIMHSTEPDMGRFASAEALDCMLAYYKVALKRFIDDIAVEVVERRLVAPLSDLLSPVTVFEMTPEMVTSIAGETNEYRTSRDQLNKQLQILITGLDTCKRFVGIRGTFVHNSGASLADDVGVAYERSRHSSAVVEDVNETDTSPAQTLPSLPTLRDNLQLAQVTADQPAEDIIMAPMESLSDCTPLVLYEDQNLANSAPERVENVEFQPLREEIIFTGNAVNLGRHEEEQVAESSSSMLALESSKVKMKKKKKAPTKISNVPAEHGDLVL